MELNDLKKNKIIIIYSIFHVFLFMFAFSVFIRLCYAPANVNWTVSADPSSLTLTLGSSGQATISVSNTGGVPIAVTLSTSSISGVSTSFSPEQLTVPVGEIRQSTLTISVADSATPGVYELTVYATEDPYSRNTTITLTIISEGYETTSVGGYVEDYNLFEIIAPLGINLTIMVVVFAVVYCCKTRRK